MRKIKKTESPSYILGEYVYDIHKVPSGSDPWVVRVTNENDNRYMFASAHATKRAALAALEALVARMRAEAGGRQ